MLIQTLTTLLALAAPSACTLSSNISLQALTKRATTLQPVMNGQGFPDPTLIRTGSKDFYAFATNTKVNGKLIHIPIAHSADFLTWTYQSGVDAMPNLPAWVDPTSPHVWAPDVVQLANGNFVMYYCAAHKDNPKMHCLGAATSKTVTGPYKPTSDSPWICPINQGGAIDPAGYSQPDGTRWVVYKVDGNAIGNGGNCNNAYPPIVPTPIMLQRVSASDGVTLIGAPIQLITNSAADGPVTEAPSLTKMPDGTFVLFFSSNCYSTPLYDVSYATSKDIRGPYVKHGPLFVTGTNGLTAPGGLDVAVNGDHAVFHANWGSGRAMFTAVLKGGGNVWDAFVPLAGGATGRQEN